MTIASSQPRVISVVNSFPSNSETFIERKARALKAAGFDVTVAAQQAGRSSEVPGGDPVRRLQLPHPRSPRTWVDTARCMTDPESRRRAKPLIQQLRRAHSLIPVAAGGYDLIHFEFSGIAAQVAEVLPLLRPAKLAVSCRGAAEQIRPLQDPERAQRLQQVFTEVDLIHCVSEDMAATVVGLGAPRDKILVNRPAVDVARWRGVGRVDPALRGTVDDPLRVLSVARLHWKKGFDDALRAVAKARSQGLHVTYRIAGDGSEREKLTYLRSSLDLEGSVDLLGWQRQDQVEELLSWADVFLLPSLSEGISNSALEAMAAGVPVVSTRCGGMDEVLKAPEAGILTNVGDTVALADALGDLASADRRTVLSSGARAAVATEFDLTRQAALFARAYRGLLETVEPGVSH